MLICSEFQIVDIFVIAFLASNKILDPERNFLYSLYCSSSSVKYFDAFLLRIYKLIKFKSKCSSHSQFLLDYRPFSITPIISKVHL